MTTTEGRSPLVSLPVAIERAQRQAQVEAGNAAYNRLLAEHREGDAALLERDRQALDRLRNDPYHLNRMAAGSAAAAAEERAITARIAVAESRIPKTEAQRIDAVLAGQVDPAAPEVTYGSQIALADLAAGYNDLLEKGLRSDLLKAFETTGRGDDPKGREEEIRRAAEWEQKLMSDAEMQRRFFAKDAEVMAQFAAFGIYAADPRKTLRE
jgi:hypothetical protein